MRDIARESLDMWIWLGDFAYVDNKSLIGQKRSLWDKLKHLSVLQRVQGLFSDHIPYISTLRRRYWLNHTFSNEFYR